MSWAAGFHHIFPVLFFSARRGSNAPLSRISGKPVSTEYREDIQPPRRRQCVTSGDPLDSDQQLVSKGRSDDCRHLEAELPCTRFSGEYPGRLRGHIRWLTYQAISVRNLDRRHADLCDRRTALRVRKLCLTERSGSAYGFKQAGAEGVSSATVARAFQDKVVKQPAMHAKCDTRETAGVATSV